MPDWHGGRRQTVKGRNPGPHALIEVGYFCAVDVELAGELRRMIEAEGRNPQSVGSAIEIWPSSADGFWPTPGPSTYGRPSGSGGLAWTGEPKWICSSNYVGNMNLVLGR